jgi:hypothetical protein
MSQQELSGDDVKCDKCQSIFDCRNEPFLQRKWISLPSIYWLCSNCSTIYTDEELLATFEENRK